MWCMFGSRALYLYVWDSNYEMRFFLDEGDIYYMNVSSNDCD
jgi:hypothetical protein